MQCTHLICLGVCAWALCSVELPPLSAANDQSADLDNNTKQEHLKWCQCNVLCVNTLGIKVKRGDKTQKQEKRRNNSINRSRNAKERAKSGRSTVKARHGLLSNISDRTAEWTGEEGRRGGRYEQQRRQRDTVDIITFECHVRNQAWSGPSVSLSACRTIRTRRSRWCRLLLASRSS